MNLFLPKQANHVKLKIYKYTCNWHVTNTFYTYAPEQKNKHM